MTRLEYPDVPLHALMQAQAMRSPQHAAIVVGDRTMTFRELDEESSRLAHGFRSLGVDSGERLGIYVPNCPEYECAFYAASKIGAVVTPLNPSYTTREITYQLNDVDLDDETTVLGPGQLGEVVVRGPQVMQGYWNAPEETARALRDGWLHTGDIGYVDADGYLFIVDRKKEMIKCKSFSIAPADLESVVLQHPAVADCGVIGTPDPECGEVPKAFVVARAGRALDLGALEAFVAERVAGYKRIRLFEAVQAIPRTPSDKILRRLLKQPAAPV